MRLACLTALTLAATALPASALMPAPVAEEPGPRPSGTDAPTGEPTNPDEPGSSPHGNWLPCADVWHTSSPRPPSVPSIRLIIDQATVLACMDVPNRAVASVSIDRAPSVLWNGWQDEWFICRFAHAPPPAWRS